jgi:hypothetical protein
MRRILMTDKEWDNWGYPSDKPCCICGAVGDNKSEPRFGYVVCREHCVVPPAQIEKYKEGYNE